MKYIDTIIQSGLFDEIDLNDYFDAYQHLEISCVNYHKNQIILLEGDVLGKYCIIRSGSVRSEKTDADGEVHIESIYAENDIFGLDIASSKTKIAINDFISNENTTIIFVSVNSLEKSHYSESLHKAIAYMLADDNIRKSHKIEILAKRGLRERIMTYLRVLQIKSGCSDVTVLMNREQLSQFLCVNRSALSNELNNMKREGIIDFTGSHFKILK